jgi:hypothetical protein
LARQGEKLAQDSIQQLGWVSYFTQLCFSLIGCCSAFDTLKQTPTEELLTCVWEVGKEGERNQLKLI